MYVDVFSVNVISLRCDWFLYLYNFFCLSYLTFHTSQGDLTLSERRLRYVSTLSYRVSQKSTPHFKASYLQKYNAQCNIWNISKKKKLWQLFWYQIYRYSFLQCELTHKSNHNCKTALSYRVVKHAVIIMLKFRDRFSFKFPMVIIFLTELVLLTNSRIFTMLTCREKNQVKKLSSCNGFIIIYA